LAERVKRKEKLLTERKTLLQKQLNERQQKYLDISFNRLLESIKPQEVKEEKIKVYDKNLKINDEINSIIKGIDKMLDE
jgi:hypothetical protein